MPDKKLIVTGDASDFIKIKAIVKGNATILGYQPFPVLKEKMQHAEEDFGITPVEAQACGTTVIAYAKCCHLKP